MKYYLTGFTEQRTPHIDIAEDLYRRIRTARTTCLVALAIEEKFNLLLDNYYEFECDLLKLAQSSLLWPNRKYSNSMSERLLFDRRIVNLLTACRLYLDQSDHCISEIYGNPSRELQAIKDVKSQKYDDLSGYRFMEALRNHVQHSELPVDMITYKTSLAEGKDVDCSEYVVIPHLDRQRLVESKNFKRKVLKEVKFFDRKIDLRISCREYVYALSQIHMQIRERLSPRLELDREYYESVITSFTWIEEEELRFPRLIAVNDEGKSIQEIALIREFLERYDSLMVKNEKIPDIQKGFASNNLQKRS